MLVIVNSQENDAVLSAPAIEFWRSTPYFVQKEDPGFYPPYIPLARLVTGSARTVSKSAIPALDLVENPVFEDSRIDAMLPGPSRRVAKLPMLSGPSGREDEYANFVGDPLTWTPKFDVVGLDEYHPRARPMYSGPTFKAAKFANPKVDLKETPEAYVAVVDVPGVKKEQVKLEVEKGGTLRISGTWSTGKLEEDKNYTLHFKERSSGKFHRGFLLPEDAKLDHIKATIWNGVLTVTVPKEEAMIIEISEDDANMDQNDVLSVKTIDKGIDKGKGVMGIDKGKGVMGIDKGKGVMGIDKGIVIGQVRQRRGFKLM